MKLLGYKDSPDEFPGLIPPKELLPLASKIAVEETKSSEQIPGPKINPSGLPEEIQEMVKELNDNYIRKNLNSCALLVRMILTKSTYIGMKQLGKENLIENVELSKSLEIVGQHYKISSQVMARARSTKWISDSANHSYRLKINEADVESMTTGLRLLLGEIFRS